MILFVVRHGETTANAEKLFYGQLEYSLTEKGRAQAAALQPFFRRYPIERVYSSDLSRACDTARLAIPGCTPILTADLREYDIGTTAPTKQSEFRSRFGDLKGDYTPYGGENGQMVCSRLRHFLDTVEADPVPYAVAFSHNGAMKCLMQMVLGNIDKSGLHSHNCNVIALRHNGSRWLLAGWNLAGDLEG